MKDSYRFACGHAPLVNSIYGIRDFNRPVCNRYKARYKAMAATLDSTPGPDVHVAIQL